MKSIVVRPEGRSRFNLATCLLLCLTLLCGIAPPARGEEPLATWRGDLGNITPQTLQWGAIAAAVGILPLRRIAGGSNADFRQTGIVQGWEEWCHWLKASEEKQ
ncbi:hypothetical protein JCM30471_14810 [Desulfuromonas carbonis]|uniref:hypothetical protein n=1 Tax=Desulfuromonas sp. DDH964 TaxID=1823759 RepID=UPI00078D7766|nr:hypothetical protein [Desulfuromonas sp. DDH964]AMV73066.1 hypothetical protein DBW_2756 [Desulfuromonas sp. DDH964]